jgi:hypothetical protein
MHASFSRAHFVEANFELHKLSVVFVAVCAPLLLALHKPRLQVGKCCEFNRGIIMLFLECNEKL